VARNLTGKAIASAEGDFNFRLASQARWVPRCRTLEATVELPSSLVGGERARVEITATLRDPLNGEVVPAAGAPVRITSSTGSVLQDEGVTNEAGTYTTFLTPPNPGSGNVTLTVRVFKFGQEVVIEKRARYEPPPPPPDA
jgi:hypothetical protein